MRGKRSKAYRKLMAQYATSFGFREPYQVLVDPTIVEDAAKFKIDLKESLQRTLQGEVKPMITQCCMRALYATDNQPLIAATKEFERRRCNHPIESPALSPLECLKSVVTPNPNSDKPNKHRYVVATDDKEIRDEFRKYPGIPGLHIMRSVMVLDMMAEATGNFREEEEKGKMRNGLKRKAGEEKVVKKPITGEVEKSAKKEKKKYGVKEKQPNPLSALKKKKRPVVKSANEKTKTEQRPEQLAEKGAEETTEGKAQPRKRRRRTHAKKGEETLAEVSGNANSAMEFDVGSD